MSAAEQADKRWDAALGVYVLALATGAVALGVTLANGTRANGPDPAWGALPALGALMVAAEYMFVRFRNGREVNGLNLVEAVLAPLLFGFPPLAVVVTVAAAQTIGAALRRNTPIKAAFNIAQWTLAAGAAAAVFDRSAATSINGSTIAGVLTALAVAALVNQTAFAIVLSIAHHQGPRRMFNGIAPVIVPGWLIGWIVNSLMGLLFVFAYAAHPLAVMLFGVPLAVLHFAYRGYAGSRSDRTRLAGLHRAAEVLTRTLETDEALPTFLGEVARCFEAAAASLILKSDEGHLVYGLDRSTGEFSVRLVSERRPSLEDVLLSQPAAFRAIAGSDNVIGKALTDSERRDCLAAPLIDFDRTIGVLVVFDQDGFEGIEAGEIAVMEALARETSAILSKGELLREMIEERGKLAEIVTNTSDGIFTLDTDGIVRSWNPAMREITGVDAADVVDRPGALTDIDLRGPDGRSVRFETWTSDKLFPSEITVERSNGASSLACSYGYSLDVEGHAHTMIVVARDVTPFEEIRELRRETRRLAAAEAAQRAVVDELHEALTPSDPRVPGLDLGVRYLASDPSSPTGGDLYDWQLLPSGEVHVAVVDVVGHGVAATKNALGVIHVLRVLAAEECPLEHMVSRADALIHSLDPNLAATVLVIRYDPRTGLARIAGGGHPPPLSIASSSAVRQIPAPGGALGWPGAGSGEIAELVLEPGDSLLAYTDGLIEARKDILEGEETLMRQARALAHLPAQRFSDVIIEQALADAERRDDTLALVIRRSPTLEREHWDADPTPVAVRDARHMLASWLADRGVPENVIEDAQLVAAELLANAASAARERLTVGVALTAEGDLTIEIGDDGMQGADLSSLGRELPRATQSTGRGLFIVRALTDSVEVLDSAEGTLVRVHIRVRARIPSNSN